MPCTAVKPRHRFRSTTAYRRRQVEAQMDAIESHTADLTNHFRTVKSMMMALVDAEHDVSTVPPEHQELIGDLDAQSVGELVFYTVALLKLSLQTLDSAIFPPSREVKDTAATLANSVLHVVSRFTSSLPLLAKSFTPLLVDDPEHGVGLALDHVNGMYHSLHGHVCPWLSSQPAPKLLAALSPSLTTIPEFPVFERDDVEKALVACMKIAQ